MGNRPLLELVDDIKKLAYREHMGPSRLHEFDLAIFDLQAALLFNKRASKLMARRKFFVVVAFDEPYFSDVYRMIRAHEESKGTWTEEDERAFLWSITRYE